LVAEYAYTYKVSETSDVYSFGVVLMELVTGRRPIEPEFGENEGIVGWISRNIATRVSTLELIDSRIPEIYTQRMTKVLKIAVLCTDHLPALRPSMRVVVDLLLKADPFPRSS
jgi:serine/threonine protein kinase